MDKKYGLAFKDFDFDKSKSKLPEGYEPLPYIEVPLPKTEKVLKVTGFKTLESAQSRLEELCRQYPSDKYQVRTNTLQALDYALIVPAAACQFLREGEEIEATPQVPFTSYMPPVYRFLGSKGYENDFFEDGELLISTFSRCRTAETKERQDIHENQNRFIIKDGEIKADLVLGFDFDTLLFCTSLAQVNRMNKGKQYGFKIVNPDAFFDILTGTLFGKGIEINEVLRGPCVYTNKLITLDVTGTGVIKEFLDNAENNILDFSATTQIILNQRRVDILMNKPNCFAKESEYRYVWMLNKPIKQEDVASDVKVNADGSIIVRIPELVQFCEKL